MISAAQLAELIGRKVRLKQCGRTTWQGLCPFHDEKTPSFFVFHSRRLGEGLYKCQGCGAKGGEYTWRRFVRDNTPVTVNRQAIVNSHKQRTHDAAVALFRDKNPDSAVPDWAIEPWEEMATKRLGWKS